MVCVSVVDCLFCFLFSFVWGSVIRVMFLLWYLFLVVGGSRHLIGGDVVCLIEVVCSLVGG